RQCVDFCVLRVDFAAQNFQLRKLSVSRGLSVRVRIRQAKSAEKNRNEKGARHGASLASACPARKVSEIVKCIRIETSLDAAAGARVAFPRLRRSLFLCQSG